MELKALEQPVFVSVVIPTHNRRTSLFRVVKALRTQEYPAHRYEIIVSCGPDGTAKMVRAEIGDQVRVIEATGGSASARNAGLGIARGELVIFLDDDMEPTRSFVQAHAEAHLRAQIMNLIVSGYSPVVLGPDSTPLHQYLAHAYDDYFRELENVPALRGHAQGDSRQVRLASPLGGNFSIRTTPMRELGGFNETYMSARDDLELGARLWQAGFRFAFSRQARANMHLCLTAEELVRRAAERARNDVQFARAYPWAMASLPFYRVLYDQAALRRWWLLWKVGKPAASIFRLLRYPVPENLRLAQWEYTATYCHSLREILRWNEFRAFREAAERASSGGPVSDKP